MILQRRPAPATVPYPRHDRCPTCQLLADVMREWVSADPAGLAWWRWRTGAA